MVRFVLFGDSPLRVYERALRAHLSVHEEPENQECEACQ